MKISWKFLNEFVDLSSVGTPEALAKLLTSRGLEVESFRRQDAGLEKVITVKILERAKHPEADRLSVCSVNLGAGAPLEIVCGAQNMKAGDTVALAQIGALLPNGLKIEKSKIRGVVSHGMLCSETELAIAEKSEGILILPENTPLGRPLAEVLGLDDTIFELSLTPNRGDALSHLGIAREIAAATGGALKGSAALEADRKVVLPAQAGGIQTTVDGVGATQFLGALLEGVRVGDSPAWLKQRLDAIGQRSINSVVDATNLVMFELGQPTHAYDADRLDGLALSARVARAGETIKLLDGTEVKLEGELVIADAKKPQALAGVMGGAESEVSLATKRVFLEVAAFHPSWVRKSAKKHLKNSEASHRFERGTDPLGLERVMKRLVGLVTELSGGKCVGFTKSGAPAAPRTITLATGAVEKLLGWAPPATEIEKILTGLGCQVAKQSAEWKVTVPSFRNDLSIPEDLIEEVVRTAGFDAIPATIPELTAAPATAFGEGEAQQLALQAAGKRALADLGLKECVHYAFTSRGLLKDFGFEHGLVPVLNPLSEEQEVMVPSLVPGLVNAARENWNHSFGDVAWTPIRFYELRPVFSYPAGKTAIEAPKSESDTGVVEKLKLAFVIAGPRFAAGLKRDLEAVDFFDVKNVLEGLFERLGTRGVRVRALKPEDAQAAYFHPGQAATVVVGDRAMGSFGKLHPALAKRLKLKGDLWAGELDWAQLAGLSKAAVEARAFKAWSTFPTVERDFALLVRTEVDCDSVCQIAVKAARPMAKVVKVFDIYQGPQVAAGMTSIAVRVIFSEEGRSLQEAEVEAASAKILADWKKELGAELR